MNPNSNRVWIIAPFSNAIDGKSADRFHYISNTLRSQGLDVTQFVSTFDHRMKCQKPATEDPYVVQCWEPGYPSNVSFLRVFSHIIFDCLIIFYLLKRLSFCGKPKTIYAALPHNGAAVVAGLLAKLINANYIVDIHDTWPESILSVYNCPWPLKPGYYLWKGLANTAIWMADDVYAESKRYAMRANGVRLTHGKSLAHAVYLGGSQEYYNNIIPLSKLPGILGKKKFIFTYAGTLGANYDLDCILEAFSHFSQMHNDTGLLFAGGGEQEQYIRSWITNSEIPAYVTGFISHTSLISHLKASSVGLNCFKTGGNVAFSYKINDYLLSGIPVINSLDGEVFDLISERGLGANYLPGSVSSLQSAMECLYGIGHDQLVSNVNAFSCEFLNREIIYKNIFESCGGFAIRPVTNIVPSVTD